MLERWTRWILRRRSFVLVFWLMVMVAGVWSALRLPGLLSNSLVVPGTESQHADDLLSEHFALNPEGTFTIVFRTGRSSPAMTRELTRRVRLAARTLPHAHISAFQSVAGVVYTSLTTKLDLQHAEQYTDLLRRAVTSSGRPAAYVTGGPAIQHDVNRVLAADVRRGEMVAVPLALLALTVVFGVRIVLVIPLLFAGSTISAALVLVYAMAHALPMGSYVPNLVELVGFGLAVDYSLLLVQRFREEVAHPDRTVDDAIVWTVATAGRSVLTSGTAVAVGLAVVLFVPVPFIRSMGFAGVVVPIVSIVAALTLQPALLSLMGRRGIGVRRQGGLNRSQSERISRWARLAHGVIRKRVAVTAGAVLVLTALALPAVKLQLTPGSLSGFPQFTESARGLALLRNRVGPGEITPIEVVLDAGDANRATTPAASAATLRLAGRALEDPRAFIVEIGPKAPYVDPTGRYRRVIVISRREFGDEATQALVRRLRKSLIPAARFPMGFREWTGGLPAQGVDFLARIYGAFPWIVLAVLLLAYGVLVHAFGSLVLPLVAVLLDALSVAATCGLLVLVFRYRIGAGATGLYHTTQVEGWVPIFLFATLFGLSMDYQVFLVSRMREAWDGGADNDAAVERGLERTGRIVSAAAIIMVASFTGFIAGRVAGLQELGVGLALGVLLDATLVRVFLMPAIMSLIGPGSWWLPTSLGRLARVEISPSAQSGGETS